ncbi:bacillithiol biosynthesis cysteine-adding enzyme BshC [Algoriphagus sp. AK58]|uniref:bacillithiol biosynthesis cysteine-adding enzyme BshC n=1 Tax=Algoriphagus sp. AK58 TaxID=1406877 RepID=UPI001650339F|nr:bacillithiol biosynthesis cysteine-adding enzyme BshC [Algoriphagus sp. AK58]MBC6367157.1 bacillithiol biosynthesis cysteine-adding enzyme BshC [Algoriphagus sp. AK58]
MKKHCVDLSKTGQFSSFFLDYIQGKEELKPFYSHLPKVESFREAIDAKGFSAEKRQVLHRALQQQYEGIVVGEEVEMNIEALKDEKTFTVTTGHQLNLFTGPLYFIYKIVSTINLAKKLQVSYPEYRFVPVYWMATEDHDFEEINYFKLDGKKYQWQCNQTGAVGDFELDASFKEFLKSVSFAPSFFKEAYSSSKTLAEAVRKYVNHFFGSYGLVVVDGNGASLKSLLKEVILSDLFEHLPYKKAQEATQKLESFGYKSQIFPREINLFYLDRGVRERIERTAQGFQVVNTELSFTEEEMRKLVDAKPERFSPNVVLRPLYQEIILPNLAYLGGPAEVVYWLQLKGVFDQFETPFPVLMPRNFALLLDGPVLKKIAQLGWTREDLFRDFEKWKREFVQKESKFDFTLEDERNIINDLFDRKAKDASSLDPSLANAFEAGKVRSLKVLDQMGTKLRKAEERRLQIELNRAQSVMEYAAPGGSPQERVVNMMQFYLSHPDLLEELLGCFDPFDYQMMVLEIA